MKCDCVACHSTRVLAPVSRASWEQFGLALVVPGDGDYGAGSVRWKDQMTLTGSD